MLGNRSEHRSAANNWLRMVRLLMKHAVEIGLRGDDPTAGIKTFKIKTDGFNIWPADFIDNFQARHAVGTRARRSCPTAWCRFGGVVTAFAGMGRVGQAATAGNPTIGSSLIGAMVSSVM